MHLPPRCMGWHACLLLLLVGMIAFTDAQDGVMKTTRQFVVSVEDLRPSADDRGTEPTLVSVLDASTLFVPHATNHTRLTFNKDFEPIWYYVLARRHFKNIEWAGCGGVWRPEWWVPAPDDRRADPLYPLKYELAQHVVCSHSSVSFCGARPNTSRDGGAYAFAPEEQYQWAAQFFSTLTSSPLSWTDDTPRHIRPSGLVLADPARGPAAAPWCSYHLVYHDTLCTQHVAPLLHHGRSGSGIPDGLPAGVFHASIVSLYAFLRTPFHHLQIVGEQTARDGGTEYALQIRMTYVLTTHAEKEALAALWRRELPAYGRRAARKGQMQVVLGRRGVRAACLTEAIPEELLAGPPPAPATPAGPGAAGGLPAADPDQPGVGYTLEASGHYVLTLNLYLQPRGSSDDVPYTAAAAAAPPPPQAAAALHNLRAGDVVRALLLFPLHLLRPQLHQLESAFGATEVESVDLDRSTNHLAVVLKVRLTAAHIAAYRAAAAAGADERGHTGLHIARLYVSHGWSSIKEIPRDANSFRVMAQPLVTVERALPAPCAGRCEAEGSYFGLHVGHATPIDALLEQLPHSRFRRRDRGTSAEPAAAGRCVCQYTMRATKVAGTTIPLADPAMTFNAMCIGLSFACIIAGTVVRVIRKLICRRDHLAIDVVEPY
ncbi:gpi transamidase component [Strigomonas culicis]|uniref:Gpi transamidase component n=1 Tax=Strigomonas culicis TaxID=28005 RepID=S9VJ03_9TRYP|nr:gpi transamidase component [Strigomonas culicis]|eukprot:EPY23170.1 gpi transamidase component [Strigomonas culicis]